MWHPILLVRIQGRKVVRENMYGNLVATKKKSKKELATRHYVLADFFKGANCAAFIFFIVSIIVFNWWGVVAMFLIVVLSRQRARYFSMLYVKYHYDKKSSKEKQVTADKVE